MTTEHTGQSSFADVARALADEQGLSIRGLARRVAFDPGYLSRVLRGERPPSPKLAELLDVELGAGGALIKAAEPPTQRDSGPDEERLASIDQLSLAWVVGRIDVNMDRRAVLRMGAALTGTPLLDVADSVQRITAAISGPPGLDEDAVQRVADRSLGFHRMEATLPAAQLFPGLLAHLNEIASLLQTCHHAPTREQLLRSLGESAVLGAWLSWDMGDLSHAASLHRTARTAAHEVHDPAISACSAIYESFATPSAQARQSLSQAREALPQQQAPATWAWLAAREAEEASALGDPSAARLAQVAAEQLSAARPQRERPWTRCLADPTWSNIRLTVASRLGEESLTHELVEELRPLAYGAPDKSTGRKLAGMGLALVRLGDVTGGITLGHQAIDAITETQATYALPRLIELRGALPSTPQTEELQESIAATQQLVSPRPATPSSR